MNSYFLSNQKKLKAVEGGAIGSNFQMLCPRFGASVILTAPGLQGYEKPFSFLRLIVTLSGEATLLFSFFASHH